MKPLFIFLFNLLHTYPTKISLQAKQMPYISRDKLSL